MRGLLLLLVVGGCFEPTTQTVVRLHAPAGFFPSADALQVVVTSEGSIRDERTVAADRVAAFLNEVPLVSTLDRADVPWEVHAMLMDGEVPVAHLRVSGRHTSGEVQVIDAHFDDHRGCSDCGAGATCVDGECVGSCFDSRPYAPPEDGERDDPRCSACERCQGGLCTPQADDTPCGCAGEVCVGGACRERADISDVWTGRYHMCAKADGNPLTRGLWCWGDGLNGRLGRTPEGDDVANTDRPILLGSLLESPVPFPKSMAIGDSGACVLSDDVERRTCWGFNGRGYLGNGASRDGERFFDGEDPLALSSLTSSVDHVCGLSGGAVWCWGRDNDDGEDGPLTRPATPDEPTSIDGRSDYFSVDLGRNSACAIRGESREVVCWGDGGRGQLGRGDLMASNEPRCVQVESQDCLTGATEVSVGDFRACALDDEGAAWCWGSNTPVINVGSRDEFVPHARRIDTPLRFAQVSVGRKHICAIERSDERALYCWGSNIGGALGVGDVDDRDVPTAVRYPAGWDSVSASFDYTCGRRGRRLYCWGSNSSPQSVTPAVPYADASGRLGLGLGVEGDGVETVLRPERVCF